MSLKRGWLAWPFLLWFFPALLPAAVIHVPADQTTIQAAVDAALDGDTILIAAGTYSGTGNESIQIAEKSLVIIGADGPSGTIIDLTSSTDGFNIQFDFELALDSVVFSGLTIQNGRYGIRTFPLGVSFGAVRVDSCIFSGNVNGIRNEELNKKRGKVSKSRSEVYDTLHIKNCVFNANDTGIAIFANSDVGSYAYLDSCTFAGNGLGLLSAAAFSSHVTIDGAVFHSNDTALKGPFTGNDLQIINNNVGVFGRYDPFVYYDQITLNDCLLDNNSDTVIHAGEMTILNNTTVSNNPGELIIGTFFEQDDFTTVRLNSCEVHNNSSVPVLDGNVFIDSTRYIGNDGLKFYREHARAQVTNSLFASGSASAFSVVSGGRSDNVRLVRTLDIENCTVAGNVGSGIEIEALSTTDVRIANTIISGNTGYGLVSDTTIGKPILSVTCNDFYENGTGNYEGLPDPTGMSGNISADPMFCDTAVADYTVKPCSPCAPANNACMVQIGAYDASCPGPTYCGPVWWVATDGSDESGDGSEENPFATIQTAVDASDNGDTVIVTDGVYTGDGNREINPLGKSIIVQSLNGPQSTIIDGQGSPEDPQRGFIFENGEDSTTVIEGFTIRNCVADEFSGGGAVWGHGTPPVRVTLKHNIITDCSAGFGGALYFRDEARPTLINNTIVNNSAYAGSGGGLQADSGIILNNIIYWNTPDNILGADIIASYSNIEGDFTGEGNIAFDPLFVDTAGRDFNLQSGSPCIDAGDTSAVYNDPDNTRNDIGALHYYQEFPPALEPIGPMETFEGALLEFTVYAADSNGTIPELFTSELPTGASFTDNLDGTGLFSWSIEYNTIGVFPVTFFASSVGDTVFEDVEITVNSVLPAVTEFYIEGSAVYQNLINHIPQFDWDYYDEGDRPQISFDIEIGSDNDWAVAELWAPEIFTVSDTFIAFDGLPLDDGQTYYVRLQVDNGTSLSEWYETSFRMNSIPTIPVIVQPENDTVLAEQSPLFYAAGSLDFEGDELWYDILYVNDAYFGTADTTLITGIPAVNDTVIQSAITPLNDNWRYSWEVRAFDGFEFSPWTDSASFWVNYENEAPQLFSAIAPTDTIMGILYELLPTFIWSPSSDADPGDTVCYNLILSLDENFTFTNVTDSIHDTAYTLTDSLNFGTEYWWKVQAYDTGGMFTFTENIQNFRTWRLGDVNADWFANIVDIVRLVNYKFKEGPAPIPFYSGDADGDCIINILDIIYLVNYKFKEGPGPLPGCATP